MDMVKIYSIQFLMKNLPSLSSCILQSFVLHGTEFRVVFSSAEWFGTEFRAFASIFVLRNGIPSYFLFRGRVRNGIPRVCFYFCSMERYSELFSLLWKGSEWNSERFLFCGTAETPSEITVCFVYSVFSRIIFLSEIPNPSCQAEALTQHLHEEETTPSGEYQRGHRGASYCRLFRAKTVKKCF
jgi:hypothetical protein